jgi:hypothetical protein
MAIDFIVARRSISGNKLQNNGDLESTFRSLSELDNPKNKHQIHRSFDAIASRRIVGSLKWPLC